MENCIILCDDSMEGIFTAIFTAYERKCNHYQTMIQLREGHNYVLFADYIRVESDEQKTYKVARTIIREFGLECYKMIGSAIASYNPEKADAIYHMIVLGFHMKNRKNLATNLANPYVHKVFELSREVWHEAHHWKEFIRFTQLKQNVLFSRIGPKNNIITLIAPHFANRLPEENFVIYDEIRKFFIIHPIKMKWSLVTGEYLNEDAINSISEEEKKYQELFTYFCHTISIKERENISLQTQMLPLKFQKYMTEFQKK